MKLFNLFTLCFLFSSIATFSKTNYSPKYYIDKDIYGKTYFENELQFNKNEQIFHLVTHGKEGELLINGKWLNAEQIAQFLQPQLRNSKFVIRHLNIYGCAFAKGEKGLKAVAYLEKQLGLSVAASDDITGKHGDWVLEVGNPLESIKMPDYQWNLQYAPTDDYDGDGIINSSDLDDDNDGIPDTAECTPPTVTFNPPLASTMSLVSGTDLKIGALYRITNVASGVDVLAQIIDIQGGTQLDRFAYYYTHATAGLYPGLQTGLSGVTTSTEVKFTFVKSGTSTPVSMVFPLVVGDIDPFIPGDAREWVTIIGSSSYDIPTGSGVTVNTVVPGVSVKFNGTPTNYVGVTANVNAAIQMNFLTPVSTFTVKTEAVVWAGSFVGIQFKDYDGTFVVTCPDTDGDGLLNQFDLDSDGDGCSDAIEGGAAFTNANLVNSSLSGGNSGGTYNGTYPFPITSNLGNTVNTTSGSTAYGIPTLAGTGQTIGTSQDKTAQDANCVICKAGTLAPVINGSNTIGICQGTTYNLNSLVSTIPSGASLVWFTNNAHTGTAYSTPTQATVGTYYAFYYDSGNNCYSPASTGVTISNLPQNCFILQATKN